MGGGIRGPGAIIGTYPPDEKCHAPGKFWHKAALDPIAATDSSPRSPSAPFVIYTIPYTLYIPNTIYHIPYRVYDIPYTVYPISYTLYRNVTVYPIQCTLHAVPRTLPLYTLWHIPYTLYVIPYVTYPIPCTLHCVPYTLYPVPYALHHTRCALRPTSGIEGRAALISQVMEASLKNWDVTVTIKNKPVSLPISVLYFMAIK